jgi:hypothetical protein
MFNLFCYQEICSVTLSLLINNNIFSQLRNFFGFHNNLNIISMIYLLTLLSFICLIKPCNEWYVLHCQRMHQQRRDVRRKLRFRVSLFGLPFIHILFNFSYFQRILIRILDFKNFWNFFRFGVCCVFKLTKAGIVNQNSTYIQNPGFPAAYTSTAGIAYTVNKVSSGIFGRTSFYNFP